MADFDSQNGWIQFVFAHEDDYFDLPSTVRVSYRKYLTYRLKKAGYTAVLFWDSVNDQNEFRFADAHSQDRYEQLKPKKSLFSSLDEITSLIRNIYQGAEKTALVVPIHTFCSYYNTDKRVQALLAVDKKPSNHKNLLLITASAFAEDSSRYFTRENGVLQRLLVEVKQAAQPNVDTDLYSALRRHLDSRCVFLNEQFQDRLRSTVKRNLLAVEQTAFADNFAEDAKTITELIYQYYKLDKNCRTYPAGLHLPENPNERIKDLDSYLQNPRSYGELAACLETIGGKEELKVNRVYIMDTNDCIAEEVCPVYVKDFRLQQMEQLCKKLKDASWCNAALQKQSEEICRGLQNIASRGIDENRAVRIQKCIDSIQSGFSKELAGITGYKLSALRHYLDFYYESGAEKVWEICEIILKAAKQVEKEKTYIQDLRRKAEAADTELQNAQEKCENTPEGSPLKNTYMYKVLQCDAWRNNLRESLSSYEIALEQHMQLLKHADQIIGTPDTYNSNEIQSSIVVLKQRWMEACSAQIDVSGLNITENFSMTGAGLTDVASEPPQVQCGGEAAAQQEENQWVREMKAKLASAALECGQ